MVALTGKSPSALASQQRTGGRTLLKLQYYFPKTAAASTVSKQLLGCGRLLLCIHTGSCDTYSVLEILAVVFKVSCA